MQPTHIFHADWGTAPKKRWLARAKRDMDGRYVAESPRLVADHTQLIPSIQREIAIGGCALLGFDFPIGIPAAYASLANVKTFQSLMRNLGTGRWTDFYNVAKTRSQISVCRPFYPFKPGGKRQAHLLKVFGLRDIDELRRKCERKQPGRRAACPLFWTLGANQVGKGAIVGWRDVLAPSLHADNPIRLWPFHGRLDDMLLPGRIVVAETYPSECYGWFFSEPLNGKGKLEIRKKAGGRLLKWAETACVELDPAVARTIEEGFPEGDDAFDAVVGLFGMIEVVTGRRQPGEPSEDSIRKVEGWILGQSTG
jgi:hypothetical protein